MIVDSEYDRYKRDRNKIKYIPIDSDADKPKDDNTELKPSSKHGGGTQHKSFIQSLERRRKKSNLSDEDQSDLQKFGYGSEGITKVDERTYTYDSNTGWSGG
mgnify:CR=1 FL=1